MNGWIDGSNGDCKEEELLRATWNESCLPLRDDRSEVIAWYEERQTEARNALIQHRKQCSNIPQAKRGTFQLRRFMHRTFLRLWPIGGFVVSDNKN